ncbi:hypothetical protein I5523_09700 [Acinetobacter oleivorans]|uniref:hypothetical protein n=1 Tax=Acinetobacter oleivorans TaxID=1148157 RepID=UPI00190289D8|nr:hypothetical protein [Acinetobacter oleivorans]MBJ9739916.1 hypothetical protein [Acinetobacter oleivorans]
MSVIVFATGGTTEKARTVEHPWDSYQFVTSAAAQALKPLFNELAVSSVANCLTSGNLWGGFLFAHEICRLLKVKYYPFASIVDSDVLCEAVDRFSIDTIICLPSFAECFLLPEQKAQLSTLKNIFYLGEIFPDSLIAQAQELFPGICIKPLAYTSQETGPIGFQCSYLIGNHYHIYEHVEITRNPESGELIVNVNVPENNLLLNHMMGDVGELKQDFLCSCGYRSDVLHLYGRVPTSRNILGTSISIYEFVRVLANASTEMLTDADLQLVEVKSEGKGLGLVLMICNRKNISIHCISELLKSSSLIKEIINDSLYFHIFITDKSKFFKSETTQKIKPFITAKTLPNEKNICKLIVK